MIKRSRNQARAINKRVTRHHWEEERPTVAALLE